MNPAIYFEPDGYVLTGRHVMGRHSAGNGFLRAAVQGRGDGPVRAYTPSQESAKIFRDLVSDFDPAAATEWIPGRRLDLVAKAGLLYRPDQNLVLPARQRLRAGPGAYSLCGVTHTLASQEGLGPLARLPAEPVMAWDALVCTSRVAHSVVTAVLDDAEAQQRWRQPQVGAFTRPLTPVIPLGVHCADLAFTDDDRSAARQALGLAAGEVAILSAGRISVHAKAHPYALFRALQKTADETDQGLVLVLAGQAPGPDVITAYREGASRVCPSVRLVFVDGGDFGDYRRAWAAADLFVSLADSIQETFGLTPIEAMAAGLPALVSDWDGYKDTVRDGVDGFRIPTWAPPPGGGQPLIENYELGVVDYNSYLYTCATAVTVDMGRLTGRLRDLATDADLRRRMGAAGQARARSDFDWAVVYRSYQALWSEQDAMRRAALADPATSRWLAQAPKRASDNMGPFDTFASFPTRLISPRTIVSLAGDLSVQAYGELIADQLLSRWIPTSGVFEVLSRALQQGPATVAELVAASALTDHQIMEVVSRLAKIDVLRLEVSPDDRS